MAFAHPAYLLGLLLVVPAVLVLEARTDGRRGRRVQRALVRATLLALLAGALAGPELVRSAAGSRRLVVAIEQSPDMGDAGGREALAAAAQAVEEAHGRGVPASILAFGAEPGPARSLGEGTLLPPVPVEGTAPARPAAGLAAARLAFAPGEDGSILLLASGRGDLARLREEADGARRAGLVLRARALPREAPPPPAPGPRITVLDLPARVRAPFDLRGRFAAKAPVDVEVLVDGQSVARQTVDANASTGEDEADLLVPDLPAAPGPREVTLLLRDRDGRQVLERRLVRVEAPPRILLVTDEAGRHPIERVLEAQRLPVATLPGLGLGSALAPTATPPDAVLIDSDAAAALPPATAEALAARVKDGLGLVLLAGTDAAAWARVAGSPLAGVLPLTPLPPPPEPPPPPPPPPPEREPDPVESPDPTGDPGLRAERRPEEALPISLLLVIDRSGSMAGPKLTMAIEGARRAAATLSRHDRVGIITFADDATLDVPMAPSRRLGVLGMRLAGLQADGNTDIYAALVKAREVLSREDAPIRHLIVLTDGQQTARRAVFSHLIEGLGRDGITLTAVGLGYSHDEQLLKSIAMWAPRGRYVPADTEAQLPTIMTRDTQIVTEARRKEAEAMARIQDRNRPPPETPPTPPEEEPVPPPPTEVEGEGTTPPSTPAADGPAVVALELARPHEATAHLDRAGLPRVGAPRPARLRPGAVLLMTRGPDAAALAASRWGLGRILVWALPPDAEGLGTWADLPTLFLDATRSVLAPAGSLTRLPFARVVPGPDGDLLRLDPEPGQSAEPLAIRWSGGGRDVDLGWHTPGSEGEIPLPALPEGARGEIRFESASAPGDEVPPLTYLARPPRARPPQAGDATALGAALGGDALEPGVALFRGRPAPVPTPRPLWPLAVLAAIALLPLDVWLHRRPGAPA